MPIMLPMRMYRPFMVVPITPTMSMYDKVVMRRASQDSSRGPKPVVAIDHVTMSANFGFPRTTVQCQFCNLVIYRKANRKYSVSPVVRSWTCK